MPQSKAKPTKCGVFLSPVELPEAKAAAGRANVSLTKWIHSVIEKELQKRSTKR